MLSRDQILKDAPLNVGVFSCPALGGDVGLAEFTADEADGVSKMDPEVAPVTVQVIVLGACDDKGNRLFTAEDIPMLRKLKSKVTGPLANAILSHNALTGKSQEELKNGSSETGTDDSASVSPSSSDAP